MSQPIRGRGGHLVFPIGPKNTNLVEDVEILLPIKFRWIPFSGFRGEVENVSANQKPGRPSCFSDRPEKHKLVRGRWDLASCQVSLNSVQRFQRRSQNMSQPIRGQGGHLTFPIGPKNTNLLEGVEILLPVKFRWILLSGFRGEVKNVSANQRPGRPSCFSDRPEKHKLGRGRWDLASCQVWLNSVQWFQRRSRKCESLRTTDAGRTDDGRTDDGRCAMTIAHLSLWLRWAKKVSKATRTLLQSVRKWRKIYRSPFIVPCRSLIESITTLRKGQGNPIQMSMILQSRQGLQSRGCRKSWTRGWDSLVPSRV